MTAFVPQLEPERTSPADVVATWDPPSVRAALLDHEQGDFTVSAILADHIRRDPRVFATLDQRVLGTLGLPYCTDPSSDTRAKGKAKAIAKSVDAWWFTAFPESVLAEVLMWRILMGFAVGELVYTYVEDLDEWRPRLVVHHPSFVRFRPRSIAFTDDRAGWFLQTQRGEVRITPGDGRWFLFAYAGERPWMNGAVRALAEPWLSAKFGMRDWNRRIELEGVGVRQAKTPENADPKAAKKFVDNIRALGVETTLLVPDGYGFEMSAMQIAAGQSFQALIERCYTDITIALLGQNLTTQVSGGSFAAASVHALVLLDRVKADVAGLSTTCREQILKPWGRLNVEGWNDDLAPWPRWDASLPGDLQAKAQSLLTLGQATEALKKSALRPAEEVLERFGVEPIPEDELEASPATPPTSGTEPDPTKDDAEGQLGADDDGDNPDAGDAGELETDPREDDDEET